ncbi:MAG TPA: DUF1918 domain-containing protein [Streptosporangiaceae bacterium]|nr:DUF1918 domain-containing protein [Streptosporangiaceae bacterium]
MRAQVGDELTVRGHHPGEANRRGEIIEVIGLDGAPPYLVSWQDGEESVLFVRTGQSSGTRSPDAVHETGRIVLTHREQGAQ